MFKINHFFKNIPPIRKILFFIVSFPLLVAALFTFTGCWMAKNKLCFSFPKTYPVTANSVFVYSIYPQPKDVGHINGEIRTYGELLLYSAKYYDSTGKNIIQYESEYPGSSGDSLKALKEALRIKYLDHLPIGELAKLWVIDFLNKTEVILYSPILLMSILIITMSISGLLLLLRVGFMIAYFWWWYVVCYILAAIGFKAMWLSNNTSLLAFMLSKMREFFEYDFTYNLFTFDFVCFLTPITLLYIFLKIFERFAQRFQQKTT